MTVVDEDTQNLHTTLKTCDRRRPKSLTTENEEGLGGAGREGYDGDGRRVEVGAKDPLVPVWTSKSEGGVTGRGPVEHETSTGRTRKTEFADEIEQTPNNGK